MKRSNAFQCFSSGLGKEVDQFLGVLKLNSATGRNQAFGILKLLNQYNISIQCWAML